MAIPDKVFQQTYAWFKESVQHALSKSLIPLAQQAEVEQLIWQMLGILPSPIPANPNLEDFKNTGANAASLAMAAQFVAESIVALEYVKQAVDGLQGGNPAAALSVIGPVMRQVENLNKGLAGTYPSAFSLGKILLSLSGDTQVSNPAGGDEAKMLAQLLGGDSQDTQAAMGLFALITGSVIDRSFTAPLGGAVNWQKQVMPALPAPPTLNLSGPPGLTGALNFKTGAATGVVADLNFGFDKKPPPGASGFQLNFKFNSGAQAFLPILPPGPVQISNDNFEIGIQIARVNSAGALVIGPLHGASLKIGELGIGLALKNGSPGISFFARKGKATLKPEDKFLKLILGEGIALDFSVEAEADQFGKLRLKNGTGFKANLPVPTLPTGPFKLSLINFGLEPMNGSFLHLQVELSASFGIDLGPFKASVDRLGILLDIDANQNPVALGFKLKPPSGIGLVLDAGIVKGGGYLNVDGANYAGVLELKLLVVNVKAIVLLSTQSEAGYSLLLLIYGQFPAIQLSFGFTLTGVGGLIGVQHTTSVTALSQGLGNGSLDAILFPANPVADAPKIINTLRTLFPVKRGGFVIGPMLELGWGTPSLVTVRLGLLIEAGQFVILGQVIVQLPPMVNASLALLYLQLDFVGSVVFDPLRIAFDAKLRNSRVAFLSITGQFAFRAQFGDHPTFLISAGGFHPKFKEIPSDIPAPFERVGTSFDIGIIGVSYKGYFAITSATVQAGAEMRMWADLGVADIEGGWSFDAICYLEPKFYFELDMRAYVTVHVLGEDFAAIRIEGSLAGPGRWHIVGRGIVELPLIPDIKIRIDQAWGTDLDTPASIIPLAEKLTEEIKKVANWSAQLPRGGEGYVTLADIQGVPGFLAHPLGSLTFQQKLIPLELRLNKVGGSKIEGANQYDSPALIIKDVVMSAELPTSQKDFFAAAQFLEMSQDDKMAKPSFEAFPAGYKLRNDEYELGAIVKEDLGYEEADLGADEPVLREFRHRSISAYAENVHGAFMQFGAAGRSSLRDKAQIQPAIKVAVKVSPPPLVVADKSSLGVAVGAQVHQSVWQAEQALTFAQNVSPGQRQVIELAELV